MGQPVTPEVSFPSDKNLPYTDNFIMCKYTSYIDIEGWLAVELRRHADISQIQFPNAGY